MDHLTPSWGSMGSDSQNNKDSGREAAPAGRYDRELKDKPDGKRPARLSLRLNASARSGVARTSRPRRRPIHNPLCKSRCMTCLPTLQMVTGQRSESLLWNEYIARHRYLYLPRLHTSFREPDALHHLRR